MYKNVGYGTMGGAQARAKASDVIQVKKADAWIHAACTFASSGALR